MEKNTRVFFTIVEKYLFLNDEITVQKKKNWLCDSETCQLCINNKYATNEENGPLIDLRKIKKSYAKINENNTSGKFHIVNEI